MIYKARELSTSLVFFTQSCLKKDWPLSEILEIIGDSFTKISIEEAADKMSILAEKVEKLKTLEELSQLVDQLEVEGWTAKPENLSDFNRKRG